MTVNTTIESFDLVQHLHRQRDWSRRTFGRGQRLDGVLKHLDEELDEARDNPGDVEEWADCALLVFDAACRAGHEPEEIAAAIRDKQAKNESKSWSPVDGGYFKRDKDG